MRKRLGQPLPLGVTINGNTVNFSVAVSAGQSCQLIVREKGKKTPHMTFNMPKEEGIGEVRFLTLENFDLDKYEYDYKISDELAIDPYVKELTGAYEWEDDKPLRIPFHDVVAYSLHVKGFTNHPSSKVLKNGTFAGLIEKLPYLRDLGINQIHLMPIYEGKDSEEKANYWGYGPGYYFLPKSAYAANGSAAVELKDMIKACHKQGIEVILEIAFDANTKRYLMHDCLRQYILDYHVDGFILDYTLVPMEDIYDDPILKQTKFLRRQDYFQNDMRKFLKSDEGMIDSLIFWQKYCSDRSAYNYMTSHNGFTLCDLVSYQEKHNELNGEDNQDGTNENYSWNCGAEGPTNDEDICAFRMKQMKNAMTLLILAQGVPCIWAGDEFGNTQYGNNNAYCQDNEISWLDWDDMKKNDELFSFVKQLISLRKSHPVFGQDYEVAGEDTESYGLPQVSYHGEYAWQPPLGKESRHVGICYSGNVINDSDFYVAYNMHWEEKKLALPPLPEGKEWYMIMSTATGFSGDPYASNNQKRVEVPARTIEVYIGK